MKKKKKPSVGSRIKGLVKRRDSDIDRSRGIYSKAHSRYVKRRDELENEIRKLLDSLIGATYKSVLLESNHLTIWVTSLDVFDHIKKLHRLLGIESIQVSYVSTVKKPLKGGS
jgi:hypothetical protein